MGWWLKDRLYRVAMVESLVEVSDEIRGMSRGGGDYVGGFLVPRKTSVSCKFAELDVFILALVEPENSRSMIYAFVLEHALQLL